MSSVLRVAASGVLAQQFNLDLIANNLANISTNGFKRVRAEFCDLPPAPLRYVAGEAFPIDENLNDVLVGTGVVPAASFRLFSPGSLRQTDQPLDLAIRGDGFFQVTLPDGTTAFTRDGAFRLDATGELITAQGYRLAPNVVIPPDATDVLVDASGVVQVRRGTGEVESAGTIQLARFANPSGLIALGNNVFGSSAASGAPVLGIAAENGFGQTLQGVLESSNVDLAEETTRMIEAQRAYQMSIKVVQTLDEMLGMANNLRR